MKDRKGDMRRSYYVYILSSATGTLYVGVTNDLARRLHEHRVKDIPGFTRKYDVYRLLYFEESGDVRSAVAREKEIKGWSRRRKLALVRSVNPTFRDLSEDWSRT